MRGIYRSVFVLLTLALAGSPALAQKKGGPKEAPKEAPKKDPKAGGEPEPEIEMGGDEKKDQVDPNEIDMGEPPPGDLNTDLNQQDQNNNVVKAGAVTRTPLSWKDILVVVRKPFLKSHRTELYPFVGTTMNDNMIRHYTVGGEISYFLTDVLAIGVEGQYYIDTFREPFDLVARQARRLPTVNKYNWSGALNFHYVPVYGKFAILDRKLVTWEVQFTAGIGAGQSEVIPRDTTFDAFTTLLIMPNVGANMRFFLAKWLTVNVGVRDYMFIDKFEPTMRVEGGMNDSADEAKSNASTSFINNVMFQIGLSFWLPTSFEYTTFR